MRKEVTHAYIYCRSSSRIYSVPIRVDIDTSEVQFIHSTGEILDHEDIEYGFRHANSLPFFSDGGMAMHHKFYTDLSLTQRYNQ